MRSSLARKFALAVGAIGIAGMSALSACGSDTNEQPAETTSLTPSSSAPPPPSTGEKAAGSGGNNSFSPSVKARPAPTALPGVVTGDPRR